MKKIILLIVTVLILVSCNCPKCLIDQSQYDSLLSKYNLTVDNYIELTEKYTDLVDSCQLYSTPHDTCFYPDSVIIVDYDTVHIIDTTLIIHTDTVYIVDSIINYVDTVPFVLNNKPCFLCVKDSFQMWIPNYNTFLTFYTLFDNPEDTIRVQREENIFWVANYEFRDTTIVKYIVKDTTITTYNVVNKEVTFTNYNDTSVYSTLKVTGYSTPCKGFYGSPTIKINGKTENISAGGSMFLSSDNKEYYFFVGIPTYQIKTITIEWNGDCNEGSEDRNVFIDKVILDKVDYLNEAYTSFIGGVQWWSTFAYFHTNGSLTITLP